MDARMLQAMVDAAGDSEASGVVDRELKGRLQPFKATLAPLLGHEGGKTLINMVLASAASTKGQNIVDYLPLIDSPVIGQVLAAAMMLGIATQLEETDGS